MCTKNRLALYFKRLFQEGSFIKNVSFVFTGNLLNLCIQLILTPVISRIYGPQAYGEFAYYNLIVTNIVFVGSLSFPEVYLIPKARSEFFSLGKIAVLGVLLVSILVGIFYYFFGENFIENSIPFLLIVVLCMRIVLSPIVVLLGNLNIRSRKFLKNSYISVSGTLISKLSVLLLGVFNFVNGLSLLIGELIQVIYALITQVSFKHTFVFFRFFFRRNLGYVLSVFKSHSKVVKFLFTTQLLNKWGGDFVIIALGFGYNTGIVGAYVFALTILNVPVLLFDHAVKPVFYQKAIEVYRKEPENLKHLFVRSLTITPFLSGSLFVFLASFSKSIFPFIFGDKWILAGDLVPLISIQFLSILLIAPYDTLWRVIGREKELFTNNLICVFVRFTPLLFIFTDIDSKLFVGIVSLTNAISNIWMLNRLTLYISGYRISILVSVISFIVIAAAYTLILTISYFMYN